ncbi:MAG: hypothetical protein AAF387_15535 [Pseudomonadota bacterium]
MDLIREELLNQSLPQVLFRTDKISDSSPIHFYFDGDGRPWIQGKRIAKDPTSRSKVILDLMSNDSANKILIGRPCYYLREVKAFPNCKEKWWTSHRYGQTVVDILTSAIAQQINSYQPTEVIFIGYSGGGTLAALVANQMEDVDVVITVAANLNVDAWIEHHGYTPLADSFDAENFPILPARIRQYHLVGGKDGAVPPVVTKSVATRQSAAKIITFPEFDHSCCWPKIWASTLADLLN